MQFVTIVLLCVSGAVIYGVVHDQVTVRVCLEYFTIGHPPVFTTQNPTLLALGWGVIATWWVGLPLGILLALSARVGKGPKFDVGRLVKPLGITLASMGCFALVAGVTGYLAATRHAVWLSESLAEAVPADRHAFFLANLWAHLASYAGGVIGGITLCAWVIGRRLRDNLPLPAQAALRQGP